jgi:glyoxylase-like metal-dependent hydrolase (beta-lactamase superfamily II)
MAGPSRELAHGEPAMTQYPLGQIVIQRIVESICTAFDPLSFFPETTPDDWARHRTWMEPRALDPISGNIVLTVQGFLVRTRHHTILIDTCVGDHKNLPHRPHWHKQKFNTFLPRLAAAGVAPEEADYVMCTHLHWGPCGVEHSTARRALGADLPKARYIFAQGEWKTWQALHRKEPQPHLVDSIVPVIEAHQAQFVSNDFALDDEVRLEPTPGHTPGHVSVHLASQGAQAVISGDCIHSPVQCLEPGWITRADFDPILARTTRRSFLERYCDSNVLVCATHFPEPSTGRIVQRDKAFWFEYDAAEV